MKLMRIRLSLGMRNILVTGLICGVFLFACNEQVEVRNELPVNRLSLMVPEIEYGIAMDTAAAAIRISAEFDSVNALLKPKVWFDTLKLESASVVNIEADISLPIAVVDSIIDTLCKGKDLRLVGKASGEYVTVPFHGLHRFRPTNYINGLFQNQYLILQHNDSGLQFGNKILSDSDFKNWVKLFYGNAFNPKDSIDFPQRKAQHNTIVRLMQEGQAWDESPRQLDSPDSAVYLAAYNEFVNRLEIFDKVGPFYSMDLALFEIEFAPQTTWEQALKLFSIHFSVQKELRQSAIRYFEERHANGGGERKLDLTEEDLLLLYPDRLRWNSRMSGATEHRYDVHHLEIKQHVFPPPPEVLPAEIDGQDVPLD
jgi:hypothetical protein